ncbi:hypothetical protein F1C10_04675 [Sphingomonas sp. NBWT7]|uniref:hypothetical protein n=1 Tax=Sphingomonas sp. NBWT7 TaxID=2596913 RepID=UPI00162AA676|nr:hypothetical protein [Sphingomonas sp. NBWT7]QNE31301.1 hypothetical protein F1C10_04675 [Sphingomonas sp. NBWT7]
MASITPFSNPGTPAASGLALDPFGYWPAQRSRIRGLGGPERSADVNYVFHTPYVEVPAGPSRAIVSFEGLTAESGMIAVRIFQHLESGKPAVTEQGKLTALLPSIAKTQRPIRIAFTAVPGAKYAVTGYVFGECAAEAAAIGVNISGRHAGADDVSLIRSAFGRLRARRVASLASGDVPTLSWPVSQGFTPEQAREPQFQQIAADHPRTGSLVDQWETAYILRVLDTYGRLTSGARGLSIATGTDEAATLARKAGCEIATTIASTPAGGGTACSSTALADTLNDFIWSRSDVLGDRGSAAVIGAIEELLDRLRPGGLAIQMVRLSDAIDRHAINRIVLGLAALGHIVAQVRHADSAGNGTPFGIVVRKSTDDDTA